MLIRKRLSALFMIAALLCTMSMTAFAHDVPDLSKKGSIKITLSDGGKAISGGSFTIYRVAGIRENNGDYYFELTGDFAESGVSLKNVESARTAKKLANYAETEELKGTKKSVGEDGKVKFSGFRTGLYLVVQEENAEGYFKVDPFLVSVPFLEDGVYLYDVNASPKLELEKVPGRTPSHDPGPKKTTVTGFLPQTGQLNWPIPFLVIAGLGLFGMGWMLRFGKRSGYYER